MTDPAMSRFLAALYGTASPQSFVELRYRRGEGMRRTFFSVRRLAQLGRVLASRSAETDVYVGVIPRRRRGGRRADLVGSAFVLWADCDTADSAEALRAFTPAPSLVLRSGTGSNLHGYWLLRAPVLLGSIEAANRRIASALGADMACTDAARIMRPASSLN